MGNCDSKVDAYIYDFIIGKNRTYNTYDKMDWNDEKKLSFNKNINGMYIVRSISGEYFVFKLIDGCLTEFLKTQEIKDPVFDIKDITHWANFNEPEGIQ